MLKRPAVLAGLALLAIACQPPPADEGETTEVLETARAPVPHEPPLPFDLTEEQASGKLIYETVCWTCHGEAGRGDGPAVASGSIPDPPSFHVAPVLGMSGAELTERFAGALEGADESHPHMRYVAEILRPDRFQDALAYVPVLTWPDNLEGSAMAGRARYEETCAACHGMAGGGDGPAAEKLVVQPAEFPTDSLIAAGDFQGVFQRIKQGQGVHGSAMPPWGLMMTDQEIWDLVAYLFSFQPGQLPTPPSG